jgi:hypothetical protein
MQDEPTPEELIRAVADFLRNDIAPVISGHDAFKLRVSINALDLVTRQLTLEQASDSMEKARLEELLVAKVRSASSTVCSPSASPKAKWICKRRGSPGIYGRPRWTSSRSTSRTMHPTRGN